MPAGEHRRGKGIEQRGEHGRDETGQQQRISDHAGAVPVIARQLLGKPALLAERGELRRKFDRDGGGGEAAEILGAIEPPGDEQERDARGKAQKETEEIGPSALGQRGDVLLFGGKGGDGLSQAGPPHARDARGAAPRAHEG